MSEALHAAIGTTGQAVWFSRDGGETWSRTPANAGLYVESRVYNVVAARSLPGDFYAATDSGVYRWSETDKRWSHSPSAFDASSTWALACSPDNPDLVFAGTGGAEGIGVYRSFDSGKSWETIKLGDSYVPMDPVMAFTSRPRVTTIAFDPDDSKIVWVGIEIGGIFRSGDGGNTWARMKGLASEDIHGILPLGSGLVLATTTVGLLRSEDEGASWKKIEIVTPRPFMRGIAMIPGKPGQIIMTNGGGAPGDWGRLLRSNDYGQTWDEILLPGKTNSTMWCLSVHPQHPNHILACSVLGQIYRSQDAGESWIKLPRELNETRTVTWVP